MTHKLLDNRAHGTVINVLRDALAADSSVALLTSRFSVPAFAALQRQLDSVRSTQLLLATPGESSDGVAANVPGLLGDAEDRASRNSLNGPAWAKSCAAWIQAKADVRRVTVPVAQNLIHVSSGASGDTAIQGSSTFTTGGLGLAPSTGYEMNTCFTERSETDSLLAWFNTI